MKRTWSRRPIGTMAVAMLALFVALSGIATAAAVVPLAKRALVADNAKKLGGKTPAQLTAASLDAAAGLVVIKKTASGEIAVNGGAELKIACDAGQKILGGGFSSDGTVYNRDSYPRTDQTWVFYLVNAGTTVASVTLYATCLK